MRAILVLLFMLPGLAFAAWLPVTPGVEYCDAEGSWLSADGIATGGPDVWCVADRPAAPDGSVSLTCEDESDSGDPAWPMSARIVEDTAAGSVTYSAEGQTITLQRCE